MAVSQHHRQSKNSNLHFKEQKLFDADVGDDDDDVTG